MPELPEVESTRAGIAPHVVGQRITDVRLHRPDLRFPIPPDLPEHMQGRVVHGVRRRAKYLLMDVDGGSALIHLGMSGVLRVLAHTEERAKHDHVEIVFEHGQMLRFTDPRRFGMLLWQDEGSTHPLLAKLGPEPLDDAFDANYLWQKSRGKKQAVKTYIMDQATVVGVGNIYAAESLFQAGIHPNRAAGKVSLARYETLVAAIKAILAHAITRGGTTLRDFLSPDGKPGYFEQELLVYGREGEPCTQCGAPLKQQKIGQRASVFCGHCQK